jgi:hypothetical protein
MMTIRSGCVTWLFVLTGLFGFVEVCFAKDAELTGMDQKQLVLVNQERIAQRLSAFVAGRLNLFDEAGRWLGPEHMTPYRALEPLALAQAYLAEGSDAAVEQANRWLSHTDVLEWHRGSYVYLKYRDLLSVASRNNMRAILDEMAPDYLDPSWDFVGENDNFPLMATAFCAFYWKMSGDQQYYDTALGRLKQFAKQLTRSGAQSEYSSQAYAFLQIEPAAMIVELMEDPSLRELALKIEERLWFDTLMHYYEPAQKMVGPYSRAYMWDMRGVGLNYAIFDMILGDRFLDQDLDDYFDTSEGWIKARNASCYGLELHCPEYLVEAMWEREYPFRFIARADGGPGSDGEEMKRLGLTMKTRSLYDDDGVIEYGCIQTRIETFMTEDYTLGTSTIPFHDGAQSETFLVVYENGEHQREVATVFARMVINGELPLAGDTDGYGDQGIGCRERGRKLAVQDRNVAMVAMTPKLGLSEGVKSLHSAFWFPTSDGAPAPFPSKKSGSGTSGSRWINPFFGMKANRSSSATGMSTWQWFPLAMQRRSPWSTGTGIRFSHSRIMMVICRTSVAGKSPRWGADMGSPLAPHRSTQALPPFARRWPLPVPRVNTGPMTTTGPTMSAMCIFPSRGRNWKWSIARQLNASATSRLTANIRKAPGWR